jgi:hypothetical protein
MEAEALVSRILDDEGLTSNLEEAEAQRLVDWLVAATEQIAESSKSEADAARRVETLCRQARTVGKLIEARCYHADEQAAELIAKKDKLPWPLPEQARPALQTLLEHLAKTL